MAVTRKRSQQTHRRPGAVEIPAWLEEEITRRAEHAKTTPLRTLFAEADAALAALPAEPAQPWDGSDEEQLRRHNQRLVAWDDAVHCYRAIALRLGVLDGLEPQFEQWEAAIRDGEWWEANVTMLQLKAKLQAQLLVSRLKGKGKGKAAWQPEVLAIANADRTVPFDEVWRRLRKQVDASEVLVKVRDEQGVLQCEYVVGRPCIEDAAGHLHWRASARSPLRTVTRTTIRNFVSRYSPRRKNPPVLR